MKTSDERFTLSIFFVRSKLGHFTRFPHNVVTLFFWIVIKTFSHLDEKKKVWFLLQFVFTRFSHERFWVGFLPSIFLPSFLFSKISIMSVLIMQTSNDSFRINHGIEAWWWLSIFCLENGATKYHQLVMTIFSCPNSWRMLSFLSATPQDIKNALEIPIIVGITEARAIS